MFTIIGADKQEYGPVSADEVRQWIKEGRADGRTLAKAEGSAEWQPLSAFAEFAEYTAARGLPPRLAAELQKAYPSAPAAAAMPQVIVATPDFNIGDCLGHAWTLWMTHFGVLTGACLLIWLADLVAQIIPFADQLIGGVFYGGLYYVFLRRIRGYEVTMSEAFAGFGSSFAQLLLAGVVTWLLVTITCLVCCVLPLPALYLKIAWSFALALVIDRKLEFWTAMELSRKVATRVWFKVFALVVISLAPYLLFQSFVYFKTWQMMSAQMGGLLGGDGVPDFGKMFAMIKDIATSFRNLIIGAQIVLLVNLPFATGALMYAYEALFGTRPAPTR